MKTQIIQSQWLIPVVPAGKIYHNHALVIQDHLIADILPNQESRQKYPDAEVIPRINHILIPGFINSHTHTPMNLLRGLADDLPLMQWLQEHIWPAEQQYVNEQFCRQGSESAIAEMIRCGTTCFNDMYFFPEASAQCAKEIGMRAVIGQIVIDFPSAWAENAEQYFEKGLQLYEQYRHDPLIRTALAPHAPYSVNNKNLKRVQRYSEHYDLPVHIHLHETDDEIQHSVTHYKCRPIKRLEQLGLMNKRLIAVHMTHINDEDMQIIETQQPAIVHCPESNMKLASGISPVARFMEAGMNIALGTDGAASNNDLDMFSEMKSAALLAKISTGDARVMAAETVLQMATINGARALALDKFTGSLEIGKYADITAVDTDFIEAQPMYHPLSQLIYAIGREMVSDVWIHGRQLLNQRQLTTIDQQKIKKNHHLWHNKVNQFS